MDKTYFFKKAVKVFFNYIITLVIFGVFLYTFIAITGDKFYNWLSVYSFIVFIVLFLIMYTDMKELAKKEIKPQNDLRHYPLKGLLLGLAGFSPFMAIQLIYPLIQVDPGLSRLKELFLKGILGPLYFILRAGGNSTLSFIIASLAVPLICMLGYLSGYYGVSLGNIKRKDVQKNEKELGPSPWNPSISSSDKSKKKK